MFVSRRGSSQELLEILDTVRAITGILKIRVTTYVEVLRGFFFGQRRDDIALDELDFELIAELQADGRTSYRALPEVVHRSPPAVRSRVRRPISADVILIATIKSGELSTSRFATGAGHHTGKQI